MTVDSESMNAAKFAAKEAIFTSSTETRGGRNTALYVPTFLTGVPQTNLHPVVAFHADRFQRESNVSTSFSLSKHIIRYFFFRTSRLSTGSTALQPELSTK